MENLRTVSDEIAKLAGDENLTSGVHKSLCDLSSELERVIICRELRHWGTIEESKRVE